jgi:hypothetical protein
MYIFNTLCAFSWNKNKKLTARMHGVESLKIYVNLSLDLAVTEWNLVADFVNLVMDSVNSRKLTEQLGDCQLLRQNSAL